MRRGIAFMAVVVMALSIAMPVSSIKQVSQPGRLGLKGVLGLLVTAVDSSASQPDVRIGDIIVNTGKTGQIANIDQFQASIRTSPAGQIIPASVLRYNAESRSFDEELINLQTFPFPSGQNSRLGLITKSVFVIREIDPTVNQPNVKPGDVIGATELGGQVADVNQFRIQVRTTRIGSRIRATVFRYSTVTSEFYEVPVDLGIHPFPTRRRHHGQDFEIEGCPSGSCQWCCETCSGGRCGLSACETSKSGCGSQYGQCTFSTCV
jgi:S1-C subfamily serine protease